MKDIWQDAKLAILYQRLSKDDEQPGESNSITNQRRLLEEYADKNGFTPYLSIADDGYSGTNFDRPGWNELMGRVDAGEVYAILVKTMDRIGRDYLRVGLFRETMKELGIRIISVTEGFDSAMGDDDLSPFREIMADFYARDISRKIRSVMESKGKSGKPLATVPIYGYMKDPGDNNARIIDEDAAEIVRRIFQMTIDGRGPYQIACTLAEEKIERPTVHMYHAGIVTTPGKCDLEQPYYWSSSTVSSIIKHREYCGDIVNFKNLKPSYKSKKQIKNAPENILVFENAIPAIIKRETWELAQKCCRTMRRVANGRYETNPLTGLLFCAQCGAKLHNRQCHYTEDIKGNKQNQVDTYECSRYRNSYTRHIDECSAHFIRTVVVRELVLDTIRSTAEYVRENEAEFIEKIRELSNARQKEAIKAQKKQFAKNEKRIAELDMLFRKVYEDNATGKLSDERFAQMSSAYDKEQAELKAQNESLRIELDAFEQSTLNANEFIKLVKRYTEFDELTTPMLNEFVDKILVYEADKSSGERRQRVDVFLNYIGRFTVPGTEPRPLTPEEQAAEDERLTKKREKNRKLREWRAKKRAERAAAEAKSA